MRDGFILAGTRPKCGKTVLAAGLSLALTRQGYAAQPIKPLRFSKTLYCGADQAFFNKILPRKKPFEPIEVPSHQHMNAVLWRQLLDMCRQQTGLTVIEAPAVVTQPLLRKDPAWWDITHLARELELPVVLVVPQSELLLGELLPAIAHLTAHQCPPMAWVAVETRPDPLPPSWDADVQWLHQAMNLPFLGVLPYQVGISVESLLPGDVEGAVDDGIDLLPLLKGLSAHVGY
jgi:dethiobiotin synthetase